MEDKYLFFKSRCFMFVEHYCMLCLFRISQYYHSRKTYVWKYIRILTEGYSFQQYEIIWYVIWLWCEFRKYIFWSWRATKITITFKTDLNPVSSHAEKSNKISLLKVLENLLWKVSNYNVYIIQLLHVKLERSKVV